MLIELARYQASKSVVVEQISGDYFTEYRILRVSAASAVPAWEGFA